MSGSGQQVEAESRSEQVGRPDQGSESQSDRCVRADFGALSAICTALSRKTEVSLAAVRHKYLANNAAFGFHIYKVSSS